MVGGGVEPPRPFGHTVLSRTRLPIPPTDPKSFKEGSFYIIRGLMKKSCAFSELLQVMARLRSPRGCPWDRQQTHASLLRYLFEEAKEFQRSVRKKDYENMEEELGDLLLQVVFHAQLAKEKGRFTIHDVIKNQIRKLTLRHPHVFGYKAEHRRLLKKHPLRTAQDVLDNWATLKRISTKKS
jgi:tetrapyrrole methylase family protein / MazG family protein